MLWIGWQQALIYGTNLKGEVYMFKMKSEHSYADLFEGILIGGSLVAMTGFLLGTKKGKQFKKELLDKYHELKDKAEDLQEKMHMEKAPKKIKAAVKKTVKKVMPKQSMKPKAKTKSHARAR